MEERGRSSGGLEGNTMEETNRTSIAQFTRTVLDSWGPDRAADVLSKSPADLEQIAGKRDFNDKYLSVLTALDLTPEDLGTEKAYLTINDHLLRSVLKDNQVKAGQHEFREILARDRIMTLPELQRRLLQAGVDHQPTLGSV